MDFSLAFIHRPPRDRFRLCAFFLHEGIPVDRTLVSIHHEEKRDPSRRWSPGKTQYGFAGRMSPTRDGIFEKEIPGSST
jgi:hypothetical protein